MSFQLGLADWGEPRIESQAILDPPLGFPSADLELGAELRGLGRAMTPISPSLGTLLALALQGNLPPVLPVTAQ